MIMNMVKNKCLCGSGKRRFALYDAAGIFCTFVCYSCVDEKTKQYKPAIFKKGTLYSQNGLEESIDKETE